MWDSRAVDSRLLWAGQRVSGVQTASESVEDTVAGSGGRTTGEAHVLYSPVTCTERFTRRWAGGSNLPREKHGENLEKNLSPEQEACSIFPSPPAGLLPIPSPFLPTHSPPCPPHIPSYPIHISHPQYSHIHPPTPHCLYHHPPILPLNPCQNHSKSLGTLFQVYTLPIHWKLPIHCKTSFPSIAKPPSNQ